MFLKIDPLAGRVLRGTKYSYCLRFSAKEGYAGGRTSRDSDELHDT